MTNEANYWEAREAAKRAALKMAAKLAAYEKCLLRRCLHFTAADDAAHNQTAQRRFEQAFLSIDAPFPDGSLPDYSFGNREVNRLMRALDEPYLARQRELRRKRRFRRALRALKGHPDLQKTLCAIRLFRTREKIFSALQIKGETYRRRLFQITKILKSRFVI